MNLRCGLKLAHNIAFERDAQKRRARLYVQLCNKIKEGIQAMPSFSF